MRLFLTTLSILFSVASLFAQNSRYWVDIEANQMVLPDEALLENMPDAHRLLSLDIAKLKSDLANAPMELTDEARQRPVVVTLPMPDGSYEEFNVVESPSMMPGLAAKFPEIKSFAGTAKNLKGALTRFDFSPTGFFGSIEYNGASVYMMPAATMQDEYHVIYYKHDIEMTKEELSLSCGATTDFLEENATIREQLQHTEHNHNHGTEVNNRNLGEKVELRTYRIAVTATAEYSNAHGGTISSVMASINTAVNRINLFLGNDCDVKFLLIDNNEELLFFDISTDPFDISALASSLTGVNQTTVDNIIGVNNYDVGHVFQQGACFSIGDDGNVGANLGGQAGGQVCTNFGKARGIICHTGNVISVADNVMTHEMAHQFSSGHTWNNCPGIDSQFASSSAFEPGSGSTIMSYSGSCGNQNINSFGINYFHVGSIVEVMNYSQFGGGSLCANVIETDNNKPELTLDYTDDFFIPISTPFELTGSATDEDGENLDYCWEQYDLGPYGPVGMPFGDAPLFRSFPPSDDAATRYFPNLNAIVLNQSPNNELLPTYSRNMTFRLTVRDNNMEAGGTVNEEVKFRATDTAGPFLVDYPNSSGEAIIAGQQETVTWNVANTDNSIVNCKIVNILLSVDGGFTYPYILACNTANDGEEPVTMPNLTTSTARIKIEAADNIFFDISNNDFSVIEASEPGFSMTACDQFQQVCVPDFVTIEISTDVFLGYDSLLTLEVISGLPAGLTPEFSTNPLMAGENTAMTFDMTGLDADGTYEMVLQATGPSADTFYQTLIFNIVYSDFTALEMLTPTDGATSQALGPDFTWADLPHADTYEFQIASSPTFTDDVMLESVTDLTEANYTLTIGLVDNTIYFWRIRPTNECGKSPYLVPFAFSTSSTTCEDYQKEPGLVNIGFGSSATANSFISIPENGIISDVNVVNIKGEYNAVPDLDITLTSPQGTKALLFSDICGNTSIYNVGLDDENPIEIGTNCPPTNGVAYNPFEPLSIFDGENTQGTWELDIKILTNFGDGGFLENWGLEFCASFEPNGPFIVNNNMAGVQSLSNRRITTPDLLVEDLDNVSYELKYTLLSSPTHGYLTLDGETLAVGDVFSQANIDWQDVRYFHTDPVQEDGDTDEFYFIVEDGTGGWLGTPKFTIVVDETVATNNVDLSTTVDLFPNPAQDQINVAFAQQLAGNVTLTINDLQGRLLSSQKEQNLQGNLVINTADLTDGIYFMTIQTEDAIFTKKFAVQR
jgi:subtilisin-like proprotein convertase family protein